MKKLYALFLFISIGAVSANAATKVVKHTIKKGETLYTVAHKHHSTIEEVRKLNGITNGEILKIGRVVKVPTNTYFPKKKQKIAKSKIKSKVAKTVKHKIKIVKAVKKHKKSNKVLRTALIKQAKPLSSKRVKRRRTVTADDIFFKSAKANFSAFNGFGSSKAKNIINVAKQKLGRKYVWGAVGKRGTFDCSGFTSYVYKKNGINIPRTSINQSKFGKFISRRNLQKGDLVFFDTSKHRKGYVNHVGIYLGNGKFIHASSAKKKVTISNLSKFYAQRFVVARRPI
ncbi:MAG TPA: peptidoglycan endopeptidase [Epsilonproteobacteria bacterium]|nr:peptidoglycan endopeptidase [Campylobacterota bacterium]